MSLKELKKNFQGEIYDNSLHRSIYATDASVYQLLPKAVAIPKSILDLKLLINYVTKENLSLIPRAAGTSLAGQCVGPGIVVDIGKYFNKVLHIDQHKKSVKLQPGVIRDELNALLKEHQLFFSPNTSTSNRCMLGGMLGNNSSGTTSIQYGVTRDKVIGLKCILSDAKEVEFYSYSIEICQQKANQNNVEGQIYRWVLELLKNNKHQKLIADNFPKPEIHRRNTGYALDDVLQYYDKTGEVNIARLICGSEGTLCLVTEIELQLDKLPPIYAGLVAAHFSSIADCMQAVSLAMRHDLYACEMMDDKILNCTKDHLKFKDFRFFIEQNPKAILLLELKSDSVHQLDRQIHQLLKELKLKTKAYAYPVLLGEKIEKAFTLRKAGLGLLGSLKGDDKAVACIEDTAVALNDLESYIKDFSILMQSFQQDPVYYAHAGAGELHLRPILNLKTKKGVKDFENITQEVAKLVKSYNGSLSGEHGDGIVRSNFIELMVEPICYEIMNTLKKCFDSKSIFNPGKIIQAYPIEENLRYKSNRVEPNPESFLNFNSEGNLLRAAENCNGSGDCRKTELSYGTMCPSYHATRSEKDTTRARANALRHYLTDPNTLRANDILDVFDLCISCKACKRECPSNVDVSSFKSEVLYQHYQKHRRPIRDYFIGYNNNLNQVLQSFSSVYNWSVGPSFFSNSLKSLIGIHKERSIPTLSKKTFFEHYYERDKAFLQPSKPIKTVFLFVDEFTNRMESNIGKDALELLTSLGYHVKIKNNKQSGRALLSKGFLKQAKELATYHINLFENEISKETPLLGIEPSAILSFRDDYIRLSDSKEKAMRLSHHVFLIEEFLSQEIAKGYISPAQFSNEHCKVKLHIHCHQKALSNSKCTYDAVNILENAKITIIPSGCCGMAGGFGYEKEHYEVSRKIGELILLPAVRKTEENAYILANGSSCRHQIHDLSNREAMHPISFLRQKLINN